MWDSCLRNLCVDFEFASQDLVYLVRVAQGKQEHIGIDSVGTHGTQMVFHDLDVALDARCGGPSGTHGYKVHRNISDTDSVHKYQPQQVLKIGCHLVRQVKPAVLLVYRPPAIEGRVGRYQSETHQAALEQPGRIISGASI